MSYDVYLDKMLLPIPPAKLTLKMKNQNKSVNLINDGEVSILKRPGLTDIDFEVLIPNVPYPFATYKNGFETAKVFMDVLEQLKVLKKPVQFKVVRRFPNGKELFHTDMTVSLEGYSIVEDAKQSFDVTVKISLKQYRHFATKTSNITFSDGTIRITTTHKREERNAPAPKGASKSHTVVSGDSLSLIAKRYYGDATRYPEIYEANKQRIDAQNKGTGNDKETIYPNQVLVIPI